LTESDAIKGADKLARGILTFSRDALLVSLRFLDMSINQLKLQRMDEIPTIATDGQFLYYNPWHVLQNFKLQKENSIRDYLHVIYHCLFHHPFINRLVHQGCWDLACDIATENAINDLGLKSVANARQDRQTKVIAALKESLKLITAEKIYRYYLDQNLSDEALESIRSDFYADDHSIWYKPLEQKGSSGQMVGSGDADDREKGSGAETPFGNLKEMMELWKQISERAQVDIETASRKWGDQKGGLHQGLNQLNREKYNYATFLKRFSVLGEVMQVNDEEFDLLFYTYGLKLYGNLPLIEPLEYKEVKRIKEFVVAIDTSGSVQGKTVQMFIQKTYNILKQTESFFTRINLHIIQCDAEVQEDFKITNSEEFEKYITSMQLRGFGGTDFRPVFTYVDQLIENKEFENLKGLIYFTDGYGTYPTRKPDYDTAFVFLDEDYVEVPDVPPWAIKLVLSTDDVMDESSL
jgi:predicted metal-dependent peptidase